MHGETSVQRRRKISGFSLIALAAILFIGRIEALLSPAAAPTAKEIAVTGFVSLFFMGLMIASILGITQLLRARADVLGLIGAALTLLGWTAGSRIGVLMQLEMAIARGVAGVPKDVLQRIFDGTPMLWVSIVPVGIHYPLGLMILGAALIYAGPVNRLLGVTLILGGIAFPLGRATNLPWAYAASDFLLAFTFFSLGWQIVTRPELWQGRRSAAAPMEAPGTQLSLSGN